MFRCQLCRHEIIGHPKRADRVSRSRRDPPVSEDEGNSPGVRGCCRSTILFSTAEICSGRSPNCLSITRRDTGHATAAIRKPTPPETAKPPPKPISDASPNASDEQKNNRDKAEQQNGKHRDGFKARALADCAANCVSNRIVSRSIATKPVFSDPGAEAAFRLRSVATAEKNPEESAASKRQQQLANGCSVTVSSALCAASR